MPSKPTFDILGIMTFIGLILLSVGINLPQEGNYLPLLAQVFQAEPATSKTPKPPTSNQVKTEADLWLEPDKKATREQRDKSLKRPNSPESKTDTLDETQPQKRKPQDPDDLGGWGTAVERDSWGDEERIQKQLDEDGLKKPVRIKKKQKSQRQPKIIKGVVQKQESQTPLAEEKNKIVLEMQNINSEDTATTEEMTVSVQNILPPSGTIADLNSLWRQRRMHLSRHDFDLAQRDIQLFLKLKLELGIRNAFFEANVILREAERAKQAENLKQAERLILYAQELAPDLSSVYLAQASIWFSESPFKLGRVFGALYESVKASMRDPLSSNRSWINWLTGLMLGLGLSSIVIVVLQFIRVSRLYFHDFHHLFPKGATFLQTTTLAVVLVLLPILFRLGLVATLLTWIVIIWLYQSLLERVITVMVVIYFTLTPLVLQNVVSGLLLPTSLASDLFDVSHGTASQSSLKRIVEQIEAEPDNPIALLVMGDYHKRIGQLQKAKEYLEQASSLRPGSAVLANNFGNVLFLLGQVSLAIQQYDRATKLRPDLAIPYYNLSRAYYVQMDLHKGKQHHSQAYRLDAEMVRSLSDKAKSRKLNDVVADLSIPSAWLTDSGHFEQRDAEWRDAATHLWRTWGGTGSSGSFPLAGGGLLIVLGLALIARRRLWLSCACVRCGRPVCRRCNTELRDDIYCGQCFHAFVQKDRVDAQSKISKEIQIRQFLRRRETIARAITFVLPGTGQFIKERPLKGALFLTIFCLVLVQILLDSGAIRDSRNLAISVEWLFIVPLLLVFLALYVWAITDVFRVEV